MTKIAQESVTGYKDVATESEHVLASTVAQQSVPIETDPFQLQRSVVLMPVEADADLEKSSRPRGEVSAYPDINRCFSDLFFTAAVLCIQSLCLISYSSLCD